MKAILIVLGLIVICSLSAVTGQTQPQATTHTQFVKSHMSTVYFHLLPPIFDLESRALPYHPKDYNSSQGFKSADPSTPHSTATYHRPGHLIQPGIH